MSASSASVANSPACEQKRKFKVNTNSNRGLPVADDLFKQISAPTRKNLDDRDYLCRQLGLALLGQHVWRRFRNYGGRSVLYGLTIIP